MVAWRAMCDGADASGCWAHWGHHVVESARFPRLHVHTAPAIFGNAWLANLTNFKLYGTALHLLTGPATR